MPLGAQNILFCVSELPNILKEVKSICMSQEIIKEDFLDKADGVVEDLGLFRFIK